MVQTIQTLQTNNDNETTSSTAQTVQTLSSASPTNTQPRFLSVGQQQKAIVQVSLFFIIIKCF